MSEKEYNAARAVVYAGAGTHVCALLEAAGIPPPPDEDLDPPELSHQEKLTKCVTDFKKATNQMKNLVEKKAKLQARADRLKQELEKLIGDVDQVDKDIATKDDGQSFQGPDGGLNEPGFQCPGISPSRGRTRDFRSHARQDESSLGWEGRLPRGPLPGPLQWSAGVFSQGNAAPLWTCPHRHAQQPPQSS